MTAGGKPLALADDVRGATRGDQQAGFVLQTHLYRGDATAEPGEPARRGKGAADALVQVVGPQVDGADAAKALDDQITAFVGVFLGDVDTP